MKVRDSGGGGGGGGWRPWLPLPNSPDGLCGREAILNAPPLLPTVGIVKLDYSSCITHMILYGLNNLSQHQYSMVITECIYNIIQVYT